MRAWCIGAAVTALVVLALAALGATLLMRGGMSARTEPSALEARVARKLRSLAIPGDAKAAKNPRTASAGVLAEGRAHFADHCASCHANDGSGDTQLGRRLYPRAPDLRKPATQDLADGELFYVIENGVRLTGMPAWGGDGHADASWALVHFIRHLPALTAEEKAEMERLNPRTAEEWRELQEDDAFLGEAEPGAPGRHHEH
jgi:mono/diheme cytochrome c family protein